MKSLVKQSQLYFIFSFLLLMLFGTLLLKMPFCYRGEGSLSWADAAFMATSASCITGLASVPISQFTLAGQLIILLLVQIGGIGIMGLTASIVLFLGNGMSMGNTMMMSNLNDNFSLRNTEGMLKLIVGYVFNLEAIGAGLLIGAFMLENKFTFWECIYYGIFHSIAGFCNAGFSPFDNSLQGFGPAVKIIVALLIISGGIGVYVIYDLMQTRRRIGMLKIHTRLVMISSVILIVLGTLLIKLFEHLEGNAPIAWIDAFFMSVSSRTAGYVTMPLSELSPNSISMLIIFMMIGAAPGSTGGGMKVTVVGVAALAIINTFLGNRRVLLFRREIAMDNILKSFTIIVTFILLVAAGSAVLSPMLAHSEQAVWFEAASALSTTGMSMDVTSALPIPAKMLIITFMFIGRIGPFTIFLFLLDREKNSRISYPEERIIIG
ncbi:MAG: potassium transporter [Lentisphaeria bacterium]|nr:potassium transporter [Lentisphaerota bacterium]MBR7144640.1 potassium transporter [Lentisphaeria bacterium]